MKTFFKGCTFLAVLFCSFCFAETTTEEELSPLQNFLQNGETTQAPSSFGDAQAFPNNSESEAMAQAIIDANADVEEGEEGCLPPEIAEQLMAAMEANFALMPGFQAENLQYHVCPLEGDVE